MVLKSTPMELDECYALNFKIKLVFSKMVLVFCFKYKFDVYLYITYVQLAITIILYLVIALQM